MRMVEEKKKGLYMIVQNMFEETSHLGNGDLRSIGMSYHPEHHSRLYHD